MKVKMADNEFAGVSLMDLAGLDTSGIEARRMGDVLPKMFADFECTKAELAPYEKDGKPMGGIARFDFKVAGIHTMIDKDQDEAAMIGKVHQENRFITNADGVKFLLGFLEDCGVKERGALKDLIEKMQGRKIKAVISHRKDPNDSEKIYAGLVKIKPID
jgi:hypothetical protein